jgi:hypothetical protein
MGMGNEQARVPAIPLADDEVPSSSKDPVYGVPTGCERLVCVVCRIIAVAPVLNHELALRDGEACTDGSEEELE